MMGENGHLKDEDKGKTKMNNMIYTREAITLCFLLLTLGSCSPQHHQSTQNNSDMKLLIDKLRDLKVEGDGIGGPYVGVMPNPTTNEIVAFGPRIVPLLLSRLKAEDLKLNEAIYIVFCLRELKATSAKPSIQHLKNSIESGQVFPRRDMTLDMQILYFFDAIDEGGKEKVKKKRGQPGNEGGITDYGDGKGDY